MSGYSMSPQAALAPYPAPPVDPRLDMGTAPPPPIIGGNAQNILLLKGATDENRYISRQVDYMKSNKHFVVAHFLLECGKKLEANCTTTATAASLFHRFFSSCNPSNYDPYLIASTCLYLAGKVEDNHLKLRDVINVVHSTLHRTLEPLALGDEYWNFRDAVVQAELLVLRMVQFQVKVNHPHKYLLHYLKSLRDWFPQGLWENVPIAKTAWAVLQDLYLDQYVLDCDPSVTSIAAIQLALETYGFQVPNLGSLDSERPWFRVLCRKATKERVWEAMTRMIDVYTREADMLEKITITNNS